MPNKVKAKIVSMTYSIGVTPDVMESIKRADLFHDYTLKARLEGMYGIKQVELINFPEGCHKMEITIKTGSVKKVDPSHNGVLWGKITQVINKHIKEANDGV